jgi:nucleotide-binding universal stress UspA family protein
MTEEGDRATVVLAAVELDGVSDDIVSRGLKLAAGQRADFHIVTVVPTLEREHPENEQRLPEAMRRLHELVTNRLDALHRSDVDASSRLGRVRLHCSVGEPAGEITWLAAALDADVVVLGTHERREVRRLLLGAVAERVVRVCGCPVMVVRDKHHAAPWRVPETEPACTACAEARRISSGGSLHCAEHLGRHVDAPVRHAGELKPMRTDGVRPT